MTKPQCKAQLQCRIVPLDVHSYNSEQYYHSHVTDNISETKMGDICTQLNQLHLSGSEKETEQTNQDVNKELDLIVMGRATLVNVFIAPLGIRTEVERGTYSR